MKILIVGKNSYVGRSVQAWFAKKESAPVVEAISVREDGWRQMDFSDCDAVIFTAALVHRPDITDTELYEKLNVQLPLDFARHVKRQGVERFVFLSTVSVYKASRSLPEGCVIDSTTPLEPDSLYGQSKLRAERVLAELDDESFHVSVIRSTYVYGPGCRGTHISALRRLARTLPVLPKAFPKAALGMVYHENLAELCWLIVHSDCSGIYMAQDAAPLSTYQVLKTMEPKKPEFPCTALFRPFVWASLVKRLFGGSRYSEELSRCPLGNYQLVSPAEGIRRTIEAAECAKKESV